MMIENMEGNIDIAVGDFGGKVVLKFPRPVEFVEMDVNNALDIAEAMAKAAFNCRGDAIVPSNALKVDLAEKAAKVLVPRIRNILNSLHNKTKTYQAEQIVATCLSEVL